jgi:phage gpG-like protein
VTVEVRVSPDQIDLLTDSLSAQAVEEVLDGIGALLTSRFQRSWRLQRSPSGDAWAPRLTPNVAGIVKDLNAGGFPKGRRFQPRPAVVDTGRLRGSLTWEVRGSELVVGTSVSYASIQNEGGAVNLTLNATGRRQLAIWLRQDRSRREFGLGWLFSKPTFTLNVRERRFIEIGDDERSLVVKEIEQEIARRAT